MGFTLKIITPEKLFFEGEVDSLKAPGLDGLFGVLKDHANMVAGLGEGILTTQSSGKNLDFKVSGGFVEVNDNVVAVIADSAEAID